LNVCSKPKNLSVDNVTEAWKRIPPLYGQVRIELNAISILTWTLPCRQPRHSECENPVGFDNPFDDCCFFEFGCWLYTSSMEVSTSLTPEDIPIHQDVWPQAVSLCH
jgi:hypothetical protein